MYNAHELNNCHENTKTLNPTKLPWKFGASVFL